MFETSTVKVDDGSRLKLGAVADGQLLKRNGQKLEGVSPSAPGAHAATHQNGGGDEVGTATPTANAIPKASATGKLDGWISAAAAGAKGLIQLATDLGNTAAAPNVVGLQGSALPATAADQFIKRNATNAAWEGVSYGSIANTVAQGNDARFGGTAGSVSRLIGANLTIAANYSMYVIGPAEVSAGVIVEIAAGAAVEVG